MSKIYNDAINILVGLLIGVVAAPAVLELLKMLGWA